MAKSKEVKDPGYHPLGVETHELTLAEVERIHSKGSPHQHLDPTPHPEPDYFEKLREQKVQEFHIKDKKIKKLVRDRAEEMRPGRTMPRYLRRALHSGDIGRIEACVDKALGEGFTKEELEKQVDQLVAQIEKEN